MPRYEVLIVSESSSYYYVEADSEEDAREKGEEKFNNGDSDQNSGSGWCSVTRTEAQELAVGERRGDLA